ncbi:uncharacterized protein LOC141899878 [Tubulanus polymorphus]|uniref:uncharacterized protein LOC141899878 n=1 Tax=Tubulanus polymorphus TaxID=672921 RepID=UPI003DA3A7F4
MASLRRKTMSFRRKRQYDLEGAKESIVRKFPSVSYSKIMSPAQQEEEDQASNSALEIKRTHAALLVERNKYDSVIETVAPPVLAINDELNPNAKTEETNDENSFATFLKGKFTSISQKVKSSTNYRRTRLINSPGTPRLIGRRRSIRLQNKTPLKSVCTSDAASSSVKLNKFQTQNQKRRNILSPGQFNRKMEAVTKGIQSLSKLGDGITTKIQRQSSRILKEVAATTRETRSTPMRRQYSYRNAVTSGSNENLLY